MKIVGCCKRKFPIGQIKRVSIYVIYIDDMVKAAQARGKYIILDCHRYVMPQQDDLDMWK